VINCNKLILAIPPTALQRINHNNNCNYRNRNNNNNNNHNNLSQLLSSVMPTALCRIYAIYPKNVTKNRSKSRVWFAGMPKLIFNNPLRFVIPVDEEKGLIQIYTDTRYANFWYTAEMSGDLEAQLQRLLQLSFPTIKIPTPTYLKLYFWNEGVHYWKPGVDSDVISKSILNPSSYNSYNSHNNLFICGEAFSQRQTWMEGALETANAVITKIANIHEKTNSQQVGSNNYKKNMQLKTQSSQRKYTMTEVKKHNKITDAWLVIHGKVYDITHWIPKHPGGMIIMTKVGQDATEMFEYIGHDMVARNIMKKYQIGIV
jgi:cytochrome b involved in lipid metabolism